MISLTEKALNPLSSILDLSGVTEIMVNPDGKVWADVNGKIAFQELILSIEERNFILRSVAENTLLLVNKDFPSLAVKVDYHGKRFRFQGSVPPIVEHPSFCIRMPLINEFSLEDYVANSIMSKKEKKYLSDAVNVYQRNILVAGSTGSGKTTLVNAILNEISDETTRYYIIEDTTEIIVKHENKVEILVSGNYRYLNAVQDALRYRPDRIIIGELRDGGATLELLKAWNTGHRGGLSTIHANSASSAIERVRSLCAEVTARSPETLIGEAIDVVVFIARLGKKRKVTEICEIREIGSNFEAISI